MHNCLLFDFEAKFKTDYQGDNQGLSKIEKKKVKSNTHKHRAHSRTLRPQMEVRRIPTVGLATLEK